MSVYSLVVDLRALEKELAAGPPVVRVGELLPGPLCVYGLVQDWNLHAGQELARMQWQSDLARRAKPLLARVRRLRASSRELACVWLGFLRALDDLEASVHAYGERGPYSKRKAAA